MADGVATPPENQENKQDQNLDLNEDGNRSEPLKPVMVSKDAAPDQDDDLGLEDKEPEKPLSARQEIYKNFSAKKEQDLEPELEPEPMEDPEELVEVKVLGQVRKVERGKIDAAGGIENYQKDAAAAEKLRQAAEQSKIIQEEAKRLQQKEQELREREARLSQSGTSKQPQSSGSDLPDGDQPSGDVAAMAKAYRESLMDGDDEASDKILASIIKKAQDSATKIDVDQITREAASYAIQAQERKRYNQELREASTEFAENYQDIVADPNLYMIANEESKRLRSEHPEWSVKKLMFESGEAARGFVRKYAGESRPSSTEQRLAEKRALNMPRAGTGRDKRPNVQEPSRSQKASSYVQRAREKRGQGV